MPTQPPRVPSLGELFSLKRLRITWSKIRWLTTKIEYRDCIDHLEADLDTTRWIPQLRRQVLEGAYRPEPPRRYEAAKSRGFYRDMTIPTLADVIVYRLLADYLRERSKTRHYEGAFFSVNERPRHGPVGKVVEELSAEDYPTFFEIWIRYDEYRRRLLLNGLYKYIVVTDVSHFFDSIQHQLLLEHVAPYGLPREAFGILAQLLDTLRPAGGHSAMPPVGIAIEPYDCSRSIAHLFLLEHDWKVVKEVGSGSYVRWMDDQNMGVVSDVAARSLIRVAAKSLSSQRLVLNAGKTKILSPADVRTHFWLDENDELTKLERDMKSEAESRDALRSRLEARWAFFKATSKEGNWDKIAARLLALAGQLASDVVTFDDCQWLLVEIPARARRIFDYLVARSRWDDLIRLFEWWLDSGNSLYEDVEMAWFESLLVATPSRPERVRVKALAVEFVRGAKRGTRRAGARVPAALVLYWLGDGRQFRVLETLLRSGAQLDSDCRRTVAAILCAVYPASASQWIALAAKEPSAAVSSLVQWVTRAQAGELFEVPKEFVFSKRPWLMQRYLYDARSWLRVELVLLAEHPRTRSAAIRQLVRMRRNPPLPTESVIARRIERRLKIAGLGQSTRRAMSRDVKSPLVVGPVNATTEPAAAEGTMPPA